MVNPTRVLISGRDFQVRYALWRMLELALESSADPYNLYIRVEYDISIGKGKSIFPDVIIERSDGNIIEIVECKEHESFLTKASIEDFAKIVSEGRLSNNTSNETKFRFVSTSPILRIGSTAWDMSRIDEIKKALKRMNLADCGLIGNNVIWDFRFRSKIGLTNEFMMLLMGQFGVDRDTCFELYGKYYALIVAHMSRRIEDKEGYPFSVELKQKLIDSLQLDVWRKIEAARKRKLIAFESKEALSLGTFKDELKWAQLDITRPLEISTKKIKTILRRGLFGETDLSLENIYVPQMADLTVPSGSQPISFPRSKEIATDLLFEWMTLVRQGMATHTPLLLLGSFGSGKSSLLTWFALKILEQKAGIVPLLIPLRDLRAPRFLPPRQALIEYLKREWNINFDNEPVHDELKYCLLCDGFDELNLFYMSEETEEWVRNCFLDLRNFAERKDICMVISSRPILLMDITQRSFEGKDCPRLDLHLFLENQIEEWCTRYRQHTRLPELFNLQFLIERGLFPTVSTPLILYMTARLVETEPEIFMEQRFYSKAEIFNSFINWTCKYGGYFKDGFKHRLPKNFRKMLREISWQFFQAGKPVLEEKKVINEIQKQFGAKQEGVPIDRNILVAHMFQPSPRESTGDDDGENLIEFTHQSFREYLVAEKVWESLKVVRDGGELDPKTWMELSGQVYSNVEIDFLRDMIQSLKPEKALNLYQELQDASIVLTYWAKWLKGLIGVLDKHADSDEQKKVWEQMATQPIRACCMATLAFLICKECYLHLKKRLNQDNFKETIPEFIAAPKLVSLLRFQESITGHIKEVGDRPTRPGEARSVLLQNLDRLEMKPGNRLLNHNFEGIILRDAVLRGVYFSGSEFHAADVSGADLTGSVFRRCFLWFTFAESTLFHECDFTDAIIAQEKESQQIGGDYSGSKFERTQFHNIAISGATFKANKWVDARVIRDPVDTRTYLENCKLDQNAFNFFSQQGVELIECELVN
jgi:hypothetical protein